MIVTCEACGTSYKIKSSLIQPSGSTVRCSRCRHVFTAYPASREPEAETLFGEQTESPPSEADYSHPGTATFLADAAETEKQLDAFFAEDSEPGEAAAPSDSARADELLQEQDFTPPPSRSESLFETTQPAGPDFTTIETGATPESDSFDLDFPDFSEDDTDQIYMGDLEYDAEMSLSDLEKKSDLDLSDLEAEADLDLADLSTDPAQAPAVADAGAGPEADFSGDESDEVLDLSGLTLDARQEAGFEQDPGPGPELEFSDLEAQADLDLSDLETDSGKPAAAPDFPEEPDEFDEFDEFDESEKPDSDPEADLDFSDLTTDAEVEPEFEPQQSISTDDQAVDISELALNAEEPGQAPASPDFGIQEAEADLETLQEDFDFETEGEFSEPEEEAQADLDFSDLQTGSAQGSEAIEQESAAESDEELNLSELIADTEIKPGFEQQELPADEQEQTSFETAQEEFDLDLETFELNLDEDGLSRDRQGAGSEAPGEKETKAETDEMENSEDKTGRTEDDLFDLELDFDLEEGPDQEETASDTKQEEELDLDLDFETEEADFTAPSPAAAEPPAGQAPEPAGDQPAEKEKSEAGGVYEVSLDLDDTDQDEDDEDDEDFMADLDLDFDDTPEDTPDEISGQDAAPARDIPEEKKSEPATEPEPEAEADQDFDLDLSMDTDWEAAEEPEKQKDEIEQDFDLELDLEEDGGQAGPDEVQSALPEQKPEEKPKETEDESGGYTSLDLDLSEDADSATTATEEDDFELNLETMFAESEDEDEEPPEPKDVSLEPEEEDFDEPVETQQTEKTDEEGETVFFSGVTAGQEDEQIPDETLEQDSVFQDASESYTAGGFQPAGPRRRPVLKMLLLLIVLAGAAAGAYVYYYGLPMQKPAPADPGNLKIAVSDPSYQFMENRSAGEILVITGSVTNRYDHARRDIRVEAGLYDQQGNRMDRAVVVCGNTLTQQQLLELDPGEIRQALGRSATSANQAPVVQAGGNLPFMAMFADPPDGIAELTVDALASEKSS